MIKKQSKTELLLNVICKDKTIIDSNFFIKYFIEWFNKNTMETFEELADDMGYWQNSSDYEEDIRIANNKIVNLLSWLKKTIKTKCDKLRPTEFLFSSIGQSKIEIKLKIKLLLYSLAHYKNFRAVDKYLKKLSKYDAYSIEKEVVSYIKNYNESMDALSLWINTIFGKLPYYLNYYHNNSNYYRNIVQTTLIEKTTNEHRHQ